MNMISKIYYFILISFTCFFFSVGAVIVFLQTDFGKTSFEKIIQKGFASKGVHINFKEIKGFLPFQWTFRDLEVEYEDKKIYAESIHFQISFLKLFKNTLSLRSVKGSSITLDGFTSDTQKPLEPIQLNLPFSIQLKKFAFNQVFFPNIAKPINVSGNLRIERNGKYVSSKITLTQDPFVNSFIHMNIKAERQRLVQLRMSADIKEAKFIHLFYDYPIEGSFQFRLYAKGSWDSFEHVIFQNIEKPLKDISGNIYLKTEQLSLQNKRFDPILNPKWEYRGDFTLTKENTLKIEPALITSDFATIRATVIATHFKELEKADFTFEATTLPWAFMENVEGKGSLQKEEEKYLYALKANIDHLSINTFPVGQTKAQLTGVYEDQISKGDLLFTTLFMKDMVEGSFSFERSLDQILYIEDLQMHTKTLFANGNIQVLPNYQIDGSIDIKGEDTSFFKMMFPKLNIDTSFDATLILTTNQSAQNAQINMRVQDLFLHPFNVSKGEIFVTVENLFDAPDISMSANLTNVRYFDYLFNSLYVLSFFEGQNWPFEISATGCPLRFTSKGFWSYQQGDLNINVQELFGFFYEMRYSLNNPTDLFVGSEELSLSSTEITMENGFFNGQMQVKQDLARVELNMQNFPIDLLSINPLNLSIEGSLSGSILLIQENDQLNGSIDLKSSEINISTLGEEQPLAVHGFLNTSISNNLFTTQTEIFIEDEKAFYLDGSFFGSMSTSPFHFSIDTAKKSEGTVFYEGSIAHIFDFLNFGANYIQGDLSCNLQWEGILDRPKIQGAIRWKNGVYENYTTGIYLENIEALIEGIDHLLVLKSFEATDADEGFLEAKGSMKLLYKEAFPFSFQLKLDQIACVYLPTITGSATGDLLIQGSFASAKATGRLLVDQANFTIPDKISSSIPTIDITYQNMGKQVDYTRFKEKYPLSLDILLDAPKNIEVHGRGLFSQWQGQIKLEGLYNQLVAKGRLDLVKGDFHFSGRSFDITSGELIFSGEENAPPFLNIFARTNVQGFTITAKWSGSVKEPNLEFSSLPPMPLSSILSYLLFGSDLSEITALQAVTLVSTAATLSGSPDILELTRRRLGLDRLAVVSSPTSKGEEDFAVQIGKYITDGVLVTFSQGMEQGTTNVIVNVDLKYGFMFQAETIQQQEQGRFSLLWNRNF